MPEIQDRVGFQSKPSFRFGMLVIVIALFINAIVMLVNAPPGRSPTRRLNFIVASMLVVNHLSSYFVPFARRRFILRAQIIAVAIGTWYVFASLG